MGRPTLPDASRRVRLAITLSPSGLAALGDLARRLGVSRSEALDTLIRAEVTERAERHARGGRET